MTSPSRYSKRPAGVALLGVTLALIVVGCLAACGSKSPQDLFLAAQTALQNGDSIGAMVKCQKLIESHPTDPAAHQARMMLASIDIRNGNTEEGFRLLNEVIDTEGGLQSPAAQAAYGALLKVLSQSDKPDELIAEIEKRTQELDAVPDFAWRVRFVLAQAYSKDQPAKAREVLAGLQASAKDETGAVTALSQSATILSGEKKFDDAVAMLQDYLDTHADSPYRVQLLLEIGSTHEAAAMGLEDKEAREAETKKADDAHELAASLLRKSYDEELDTRKRVGTGLQLADIYRQLRQYDKSLEAIGALRTDTVTSDTQERQQIDALLTARESVVYLDQDMKDKAIEVLQKGIEAHAQDEGRAILYGYLVDLYVGAKDFESAKQTLEKMRAEFQNTPTGQQAEAALGQLDRMIAQQAAATTATTTAAPANADAPAAPAAPANE